MLVSAVHINCFNYDSKRITGAKRGICAAIDTGASIGVLLTRVYYIVFPYVTIQPTKNKLSAYNNTPINVVGEIDVPCKYNNTWKPLTFLVTDEHTKTIIGKRDAISLKCIKFLDRVFDLLCKCHTYVWSRFTDLVSISCVEQFVFVQAKDFEFL